MVLNEMDLDKDGTISLGEFERAADIFMALAEAPAQRQPAAAGEDGGGMSFFRSLFGQ